MTFGNNPSSPRQNDSETPDVEEEVEQALALCGGDPIDALRATLIADAFLEAELERGRDRLGRI